MDAARWHRRQLTIELAALIATADDPTLALRQHQDDLVDELILGRLNLASSGPSVEAFREAIGHSVRAPDEGALGERGALAATPCSPSALGERDGSDGRRAPARAAATPSAIRKDAGASRSPSARRLHVINGDGAA